MTSAATNNGIHNAISPGRKERRPTAIDLFAGAGGFSLGLEQAGFDVLAAVEYDAVHAATHAFNFPRTEIVCSDVADLSSGELRDAARRGARAHGQRGSELRRKIDLIVGGPPCQGFSMIGKRLVDDQRNQLVFHFFRLVCELRPRYFVMENVPGMGTGEQAGILKRLISEFHKSGYSVRTPVQTLNAADYGVPQERRRLFLLGWRDGEQPLDYPDPLVMPAAKRPGLAQSGTDHLPQGPTVADAIGDLPDHDHYPELLSSDTVLLDPTFLVRLHEQASPYARRLRSLDADDTDLSRPRRWDPSQLTASMRTRHTRLSIRRFASTNPGETEPVSRFYRLHPGGLCNTLRAGTGSERGAYTSARPIHPTYPRVLSVREAARLHSFPDWFRPHSTKWHGFRQVGNAVAPLVGRAVAAEVREALQLVPSIDCRPMSLGDPTLLKMRMSDAAQLYGADSAQLPAQRTRQGTREKLVA